MCSRLLVLTLASVLPLGCAVPETGVKYETATLILPEGDPESGREAFMTLGCGSCHAVAWETELPAPVADPPGPELGLEQAQQSAGLLATSIIAPSHFVPADLIADREDRLSPMGDFNETMTVRQLIDVVAYLRSRGTDSYTQVRFRDLQ